MDVSPDEVRIRAIGVVRNGVRRLDRRDWSGVRSRVELRPGVEESLLGLRDYSHVLVLGWLHLVPAALRERQRAYPAGDERLPLQGALALRGAARPNPLAVTVCKLVAVEESEAGEGAALVVSGLDLVDGTPVLDVKPYIAAYDSVPGATLPRWARG